VLDLAPPATVHEAVFAIASTIRLLVGLYTGSTFARLAVTLTATQSSLFKTATTRTTSHALANRSLDALHLFYMLFLSLSR